MNLFRHKKAKHVEKPVIEKTIPIIPCIYCGRIFDSKSKGKNHIKTHLVTKEPKESTPSSLSISSPTGSSTPKNSPFDNNFIKHNPAAVAAHYTNTFI